MANSDSNAGTRYSTLTSTDQSANVWVVALISLCLSTACFVVRVISKSRAAFKMELDDYVLAVGYSLSVVQVALTIKSLTLGLGKDVSIVPAEHVTRMEDYLIASLAFGILSLYIIKISMIFLIQRLFHRSLFPFWIAFAVLGVASIITVAAGCSYRSCTHALPRWIVADIFDILTELVIIGLPIYCIRDIQMARIPKIKVQGSFFSRLIIVLFTCLGIWSISRMHFTGQPSTAVVLPIVFSQLELCLSICIASILPCFRFIFQSSEKVPTGFSTNGYTSERKDESGPLNFDMRSMDNHTAPGAVHPKKPEHSAASSQDMGAAHSHTTDRISSSSHAPSGATGQTALSQKALVV